MSWDSKTNLPRRSRGLSIRQKATAQQPSAPVKIDPKSAHTSDPFLQGFLNPAFDPAEHLNSILPTLQGSSSSASSSSSSLLRSSSLTPTGKTPVPLAQLSSEAQDLLTQLNAHTTRLTNTLTQLTDDILRSGSRLAYEVELLRGETLGLAETLADEGPLGDDLERFVPGGVHQAATSAAAASARRASLVSAPASAVLDKGDFRDSPVPMSATTTGPGEKRLDAAFASATADAEGEAEGEAEPQYISQLRTLTLVRSRLDSVIKTFGDAMEFTFPPSEFSVSSGFLSVSAPDFPDMHSATREQISTEEKGQQVLRKIREEVVAMLARGSAQPVKGVEDATARVEELKELSVVWKGTAEEKGRQRFVENLARVVEDRHRELVRDAEAARDQALRESRSRQDDHGGSRRDQGGSSENTTTESKGLGGYGFMKKWQDLRGGL